MIFLFDFDFDDFAEGGVGFGLKFFITLGLIAVPLIFVRDFDNNVVYGTIVFSIALAILITSVISLLVKGINILSDKSEKRNRKIISYLLSLTIFIVSAVYGYSHIITISKFKIQGLVGMSILPLIVNLIASIPYGIITKKLKIFEFIIGIVLKVISTVFISAIIFFVLTFYHRFGIQDSDYKNTKFGNSAKSLFKYIEKNAAYYDSSYEKARNGKNIKEILQEKVNTILELSSNEDEILRLSKLSNENDYTLREDKLLFLFSYVNSKSSMQTFKEEYGLNMKFRAPFYRCEKYKQNRILTTYDKATQMTHYYIFNTDTCTINEEIPKDEYSDYVNKIIQEAKRNQFLF